MGAMIATTMDSPLLLYFCIALYLFYASVFAILLFSQINLNQVLSYIGETVIDWVAPLYANDLVDETLELDPLDRLGELYDSFSDSFAEPFGVSTDTIYDNL
jgi:hypothetical protein